MAGKQTDFGLICRIQPVLILHFPEGQKQSGIVKVLNLSTSKRSIA